MVLAVIPSRYQSSRFPGKSLVPIAGIPLLTRVVRRVLEAGVADRVLVATDDPRIAATGEAAGAEVWLSQEAFRSGSDRVAAASDELGLDDTALVLNVQGDEPLVDAVVLAGALRALQRGEMGTVAVPADPALLSDEDAVKVHVKYGRAVGFARRAADLPATCQPLLHLGVYAFSAGALRRFAKLPSTDAERARQLEQLRALDHGMTIGVEVVSAAAASVNRPEDVVKVETMISSMT